jgi:hypothetical protein
MASLASIYAIHLFDAGPEEPKTRPYLYVYIYYIGMGGPWVFQLGAYSGCEGISIDTAERFAEIFFQLKEQ